MTVLYCISEYRNATESYQKGDVIEVSPQKATELMNDSPGSFTTEKPVFEKKSIVDEPPKNKAISEDKPKKRSTSKSK